MRNILRTKFFRLRIFCLPPFIWTLFIVDVLFHVVHSDSIYQSYYEKESNIQDTISQHRTLFHSAISIKYCPGGHFNIGHYYVLYKHQAILLNIVYHCFSLCPLSFGNCIVLSVCLSELCLLITPLVFSNFSDKLFSLDLFCYPQTNGLQLYIKKKEAKLKCNSYSVVSLKMVSNELILISKISQMCLIGSRTKMIIKDFP